MAVITLASGSGSPGVTTTALALALSWPRPVLVVEADPSGASQISAGWFRGRPQHNRGLLNLALAHRQGVLGESLRDVVLPIEGSNVAVVAGIRSHVQVTSVQDLWEPLASVLHGMEHTGTDVIVDAGRLGLLGSPLPLLRTADAVLLTTRSNLPAIAGVRGWATQVRQELAALGLEEHLGLLVVGDGRPYPARDVARTLGLPVIARLAWDPDSAETFSTGKESGKDLGRAPLSRSVRAAVSAIHGRIADNRARLQPGNLVVTAPEGSR